MKQHRITLVWLALMAFSTASYFLADGATSSATPLFAMAAIKLFLIQAIFMELLGCRPIFLRLAALLDLILLGLLSLAFDA
ncbi:MAG: hypothetical protein ACPG31_00450 [Planctomycetota bacterium]